MVHSKAQTSGVIVQIMGEEYRIATQREYEDVQRIAAYVDQRMRELAAQHPRRVPRATLAVLAAMEITGELLGALSQQRQLEAAAEENLARLNRLVDARAGIPAALGNRAVPATPQRAARAPGRHGPA